MQWLSTTSLVLTSVECALQDTQAMKCTYRIIDCYKKEKDVFGERAYTRHLYFFFKQIFKNKNI